MPKTGDKLTKYGPAKSSEYSNAPYDEEECSLCVGHQDYPTHDECENERKYAVTKHTDALEEGTENKSSCHVKYYIKYYGYLLIGCTQIIVTHASLHHGI